MEIPYTVTPRPDTGLTNPKLGIWLFLASEVMLFGGLFSGYLFLRLGAEDGYWPHGLLNVPVGTFNTAVLIASSVTVVLAWAALKMRKFGLYQIFLAITIACGALFLIVKLAYEYPDKYSHFGAVIKKESFAKYEKYLGNEHLKAKKLPPRVEISGHLHKVVVNVEGADPALLKATMDKHHLHVAHSEADGKVLTVEVHSPAAAEALERVPGPVIDEKSGRRKMPGVKLLEYEVETDAVNANPADEANERPHFIPRARPGVKAHEAGMSHHDMEEKGYIAKIKKEDVQFASSFAPKHNSYFAIYFTITGLHGLHVFAGIVCFTYFFITGPKLYKKNPEQLANRIEVSGLFWHFVDLVWIFVFPIFYLL